MLTKEELFKLGIESEDDLHVSISSGNFKMGKINSVSLPPLVYCISCGCCKQCYARRLQRYKQVKNAWLRNSVILDTDREKYFREVEGAIMLSRFFRFHVSGDIVDDDYFFHMCEIASRYPSCEILAFTKKFDIVNKYIGNFGELPKNLHIIFSAWKGLQMSNPFLLPEAHVLYNDGITTANDGAKYCGGNCTVCAKEHCGCWSLQKGEQVIFKQH